MDTVETKARNIVLALEKKPSLFFQVLQIVRDEYSVAGPWAETVPGELFQRHTLGGSALASVLVRKDGSVHWCVGGESGDTATAQGGMAMVDEHLREIGHILP